MAYELLFTAVLSLMGVYSVCSLSETDTYPSPTFSIFSCRKLKCPPGFSTFCDESGKSRCERCVKGTFTENHSRRKDCRPCTRCRDDQFELKPCTPTSNVICKECSKCDSGFGVLKPCERTRDTICEKCRPVAEDGVISYPNIECNRGGSEDPDLIFGKSNEKEKPKDSMTIIEVERPWPDVKKEPKHQQKLTVDEKHGTTIVSSRGFPSVNPSPSSSFSTKSNSAATQRTTLSSDSVGSVSPSVVASSKSITVVLGKSIGPSPTPAIPAERQSSPKVQRTKATEKPEFYINTGEPPSDGMQGDEPRVARHTWWNVQQNSTTSNSLKPRELASSVSPETENMFDLVHRGMTEEHSTESRVSKHYTLESGTEHTVKHEQIVPSPRNRNRSSSLTSSHWLWAVVALATMTVSVLTLIGVNRCRRHLKKTKGCLFNCPRPKCRPPRCTGSSDCCDSTSLSSDAEVYTEQNGNQPVSVITENDDSLPNSNNTTLHTYLPSERTTVVADVHHNTVFDLFNIREQLEGTTRPYPEYITQVEATFNSSGGKLCAPNSNVRIIVDSGAVPEGINQPFFFRVVYDETSLLRDIPETPDSSLISPVIQCGPEDINLLKPVEVVVPHCLYVDEVKKESITVYRCAHYSEEGPINWEKVPSASEKNGQSKAWFTVKKDSIHIKTKVFSFWSVFACGGPKKKRATVFSSRPNPKSSDLIYLRFYIYSDNEDSKKRVEVRERERFPDSKAAKEKPFKMYNDDNDITVKLTDLEEGWQLDKTDSSQTYTCETAYRNGFRSKDSCDFVVKPTSQGVNEFSCILRFQQEEHTPEHTIYLNPGFTPRQAIRRFSVESTGSETHSNNNNNSSATGAGSISVVPEETEPECSEGQENEPSTVSLDTVIEDCTHDHCSSLGSGNEPVTERHCRCIYQQVGGNWKDVLRKLSIAEVTIERLDEDYCGKVAEKFYQGLLAWSRGTQRATTKKLCEALRLAGCSEALETLSREGVTSDAPAPMTCV